MNGQLSYAVHYDSRNASTRYTTMTINASAESALCLCKLWLDLGCCNIPIAKDYDDSSWRGFLSGSWWKFADSIELALYFPTYLLTAALAMLFKSKSFLFGQSHVSEISSTSSTLRLHGNLSTLLSCTVCWDPPENSFRPGFTDCSIATSSSFRVVKLN